MAWDLFFNTTPPQPCRAARSADLAGYRPRLASAKRMGPLEMRMIPSNGPSSSKIRNTAAATDNVEMTKTVITVAFLGALNPKLANVIDNQKITTIRNCFGTAPPALSSRQRVRSTSEVSFNASDLNHRCDSFC